MAPGVLALVKGHLTVVQDMAGGLPALAQLAEVTGTLSPLQKVVASWECIGDSIEVKFHCSLFHIVDERLFVHYHIVFYTSINAR